MKTKTLLQRLQLSTYISALALLAARPVAAATDLWTGGGNPDGNWANPANWGGTAPSALDRLQFTGSTQTLATNNYTAGTIFNNLTFDALAGSFSLAGNSLVLTNGIDIGTGLTAGGGITNLSANAQANAIPITLSAGIHNIVNYGTGKLNLNGPITRNTGAFVVFTNSTGAGGFNVTGGFSTNGQNNILGGWALIGNDWATLDANSNVVAYTGYTSLATGAIANNSASNIKLASDSGNYTAATGATVNSILSLLTVANRNVTITGTMKLGSRGGVFRSPLSGFNPTITGGLLTAAGGGELTFSDGPFSATGNNLTVNSIVSNDTPNVVSVNIQGYVAMGAANTYSGGTYVNEGRVQLGANSTLGTGPVYVYPGGEVSDNGHTPTNNFYLYSVGTTESGGLGAIRMNGQTLVGTITLLGTSALGVNGVNVLLGPVSGPGGLIVGSGSSANGNGTLVIGATNSYNGDTIICNTNSSAADILKFNSTTMSNAMPYGVGNGNLILNAHSSTVTATFDVFGTTETVNGLISTPASPANNFVTDSSGGGQLIVGGNNATATFGGLIQSGINFTKIGTGTQTLTGASSFNGNTLVEGGTLALTGTGSISSSTSITVSNATLDVSGQSAATFNLTGNLLVLSSNSTLVVSAAAQPTISTLQITNSALQTSIPLLPITNLVVTTLDAGGTANPVNITSMPGITSYPQQFALIQYANNTGNAASFVEGTMPSTYSGYISNDTVHSIIWLVATNGPLAKVTVWNGNVNGNWDTTTLNWLTGTATNYNQGDFATFDDTLTGTPNVILTTALAPFSLTFSNSVANYVFTGPGKITGTTGLNMQGTASVLLDNSTPNDFSGQITVAAGTLKVGNNDANGGLGSGALTNGGTLAFNRTDSYTNNNAISGSGTINQNGTGTLTLSGANAAFTGPAFVTQGTLRAGTGASLGTTDGGLTVSSGAALDDNGQTITNETVTVSGTGIGGAGVIVSSNTAVAQLNALTNVTLAADATIGGSGRWDIRGANDSLNLNGFTLTKVGTNQISVVNAIIGSGNIVINQGDMDIETAGTSGTLSASGTITVNAGASLGLYANPANTFLRPVTLNGGSIRCNGGALSALDAPVTLTANSTLDSNGGNPGTVINSVISGNFAVTKINTGTIFLGGMNTYGGVTTVSAGTLALTNAGSIASSPLITVSNATLDVSGESSYTTFTLATNLVALTSNAVLNVNGSYQPDIGILALTNSTIRLVGVNNSQLGVFTTNLDLGAPTNFITVVSFSTPPTQTQFPLVQYTSLVGTFNVGLTLPAGYSGYLSNNVANSSIDLVLTASLSTAVWNGGNSAVDSLWSDAVNWSGTALLLNNPINFNGGSGLVNTNNLAPGNNYSSINFNNGPYVINGNPIILNPGGGITNNVGLLETVNLGLDSSTTNINLAGGSGGLIIGGGITNTGTASETLNLFGTGTISNLLATPGGGGFVFTSSDGTANWSILDNGSSTPITLTNGGFALTGGATLNFGSASSAPNFTCAAGYGSDNSIGNGIGTTTFNMINGTLTLPVRIDTEGDPGGNVNVSGGTLNVAGQMQNANGSANDTSTVTVSGGVLNIGTPTAPGNAVWDLASRGTGTLYMNGGLAECSTLDITRNAAVGTVGTVHLNGGTLVCSQVSTVTHNEATNSVTGTTATVYFNGGTLKASASSPTFYLGGTVVTLLAYVPINSYIQAGGAIINDGGFSISILEALQPDPALGGSPDGGLLKLGAGTLTLSNVDTYTGNTVISNGTLAVNGTLGTTTVRVAVGTLAGIGSLGGSVNVSPTGTISPAGSGVTGALTISGNLTLQGVTAMDINHTTATNDVINSGTVTYGGTLVVTNLAGVLTTNDTFKLFNAGSYAGMFTALTPVAPAPGFGWNTNTLTTDGVLRIVQTVNLTPTNITSVVSGSTLTLSWPADHTGWRLLVQTDSVASGLNPATNAWFTVPGSTGINSTNMTLDPANGTVFYRLVYP